MAQVGSRDKPGDLAFQFGLGHRGLRVPDHRAGLGHGGGFFPGRPVHLAVEGGVVENLDVIPAVDGLRF